MKYKLSMFDFNLPQSRIVNKPRENREDAKLMILNRETNDIQHTTMENFGDYFVEGDVIAINNTKVFPARLYANKKPELKLKFFYLESLIKKIGYGTF